MSTIVVSSWRILLLLLLLLCSLLLPSFRRTLEHCQSICSCPRRRASCPACDVIPPRTYVSFSCRKCHRITLRSFPRCRYRDERPWQLLSSPFANKRGGKRGRIPPHTNTHILVLLLVLRPASSSITIIIIMAAPLWVPSSKTPRRVRGHTQLASCVSSPLATGASLVVF